MSSVYTGTTNKDGKGTAADLVNDGLSLDLEGSGSLRDENADGTDNVTLTSSASVNVVNWGDWNQYGYKEVKVQSDTATEVTVENFVDFDIDLTSSEDLDVSAHTAKRGQVDTSSGSDTIHIEVFSNDPSTNGWANMFQVNSGAGGDTIKFTAADIAPSGSWWYKLGDTGTQYTQYIIDAGAGNDTVDVSDLEASVNMEDTRQIDGGEGFDIAVVADMTNLDLTGFEVICGTAGVSALTYDHLLEVVENDVYQGTHDFELLLNNVDVSAAIEGHPEMSVRWLTTDEADYLSDLRELEGCDLPSDHDIATQYAMVTFEDDLDNNDFISADEVFSFISNDSDILPIA